MNDLNLEGLTDSQLRLFAVRCARRVQHLMTDPRSISVLDVAERHARGEATDDELAAARLAAADAAIALEDAADWDAADLAWAAAYVARDEARDAAWAAEAAAWAAEVAAEAVQAAERAAQAEILEQIRQEQPR